MTKKAETKKNAAAKKAAPMITKEDSEKLVEALKTAPTTKAALKLANAKAGKKAAAKRAQAAQDAPKQAKATKQASDANGAPTLREGSKGAAILALLERKGGATTAEMMQATGWTKAHSVRGFLSAVIGKKLGIKLAATRGENGTTYTIA
jgi:hypothetical protein